MFVLRAEKVTVYEPKLTFSARNTNIYKICKLHKAIFSVSYNIRHLTLQFTNLRILFLAAVKDFVLFAYIEC